MKHFLDKEYMHILLTGQTSHKGLAGKHTSAPKSIIAKAKSRGFSVIPIASYNFRKRKLRLEESVIVRSNTRPRILTIFVSSNASDLLKAKHLTAEEMYSLTPGRDLSHPCFEVFFPQNVSLFLEPCYAKVQFSNEDPIYKRHL